MSSTGHVFQINTSKGGVPKHARPSDRVTAGGLDSDGQAHPEHHGGQLRAVSLFALERILALQAEGHPIYPGATGENLTLSGVDWDALDVGSRLRIGDAVRLEITGFATPCQQIAAAFADGRIRRVLNDAHPGWSRLYARVLTEGPVRIGDPVTPEPTPRS